MVCIFIVYLEYIGIIGIFKIILIYLCLFIYIYSGIIDRDLSYGE